MTQTPAEMAADVQQMGLAGDNGRLAQAGIEPVTPEAVPYYAAWTRTDIALSASLLCMIANDMRELVKYAKLAVGLLFLIAAGIALGRLR
jgi:hypothetical protein